MNLGDPEDSENLRQFKIPNLAGHYEIHRYWALGAGIRIQGAGGGVRIGKKPSGGCLNGSRSDIHLDAGVVTIN
jgi:hypothetical protein